MSHPSTPGTPYSPAEQQLIKELRQLYLDRGEPSLRKIAQETDYSPSTIHSALREYRVPTLPVLVAVVRYLGGDVGRFQGLHELIRAEELGLSDRAEQLSHDLNVPAQQSIGMLIRDGSTVVHNFFSGESPEAGSRSYNPLAQSLPKRIREVYESACDSFERGSYTSCLVLARWVLEAVVKDKVVDHSVDTESASRISQDLDLMAEFGVLDPRLREWARTYFGRANDANFKQLNHATADSAKGLLDLVSAIVAYVYLVREGLQRFKEEGLKDGIL